MAPAIKSLMLASALVLAASLGTGLAAAKPKGKDHGAKEGSGGVEIRVDIRLGDSERRVVRDYYSSQTNCPPGLAKKNNGCLPPGIAKKRHAVGRPLSGDAVVVELPYDLVLRLPPLSAGRGYRLVDGDLAVIALSTLIVLDAIELI